MKHLFNDNWEFAKTKAGALLSDIDGLAFKAVDLPHDWLIWNSKDLYESSYGFYRKTWKNSGAKSVRLYFEGVYQDCTVYVNGKEAGENKYGYSTFEVDISDFLCEGDNSIVVLVRHDAPNSRWYSGAGIFRDVYIIESGVDHLATDGVYFYAKKCGKEWNCTVSAEICGDGEAVVCLSDGEAVLYNGAVGGFTLTDAPVWDIDDPKLLTLSIKLMKDGCAIDEITQNVGLREIEYKPEAGFFLNGRHVKLHGVCLHHDLGALGAAFNKEMARRQLLTMKRMGVNAVRTSHNMPAKGFMELCDELGILVDSEAFDMWERPKTEFDYARFFPEWFERDVASWVRRDRNHPSVIMWSVGNEIYDTHFSDRGREVAKMLHEAVRKHDPLCNAPTTIGSNYMPWDGAQNCAKEVDLAGYNYGENLYRLHREQYPDWKIYGSETTSGVKSRGVYHFPRDTAFLTHDDLQCSSLGNCRAGAAAPTPQKVIAADRDTDFCAGMFIWTGTDYIGEPSPYSTKNAYYGPVDTAGLEKDAFWLYKAAWTDKPVLYLFPYWDFNDGQLIDVVAYTNLCDAELFVNGVSQGVKAPKEYTVTWNVPYEKGEIKIIGHDSEGNTYEDVKHSFSDSAAILLSANKSTLKADGEDMLAVTISTVDKDGYPVENARDRITVEAVGAKIVGFDNGDSTDYDSYKCNSRKLFSGKAVVLVKATDKAGTARVIAHSPDLPTAEIAFEVLPSEVRSGASFNDAVLAVSDSGEIPVRKIQLSREGSMVITPDAPAVRLTAEILPANATHRELIWSVVTNSGIATKIATVEADGNSAVLTAIGDGEFRLRCASANGKPQPEVLSEYEFKAEGFGQPFTDPYSFVTGCFYNVSNGLMNEVSGGGISMTREQNTVGFTKVDFGRYGSDTFTLRMIHWHTNSPAPFGVYDGDPDKGGRLLGEFSYQADFIWQTYQDNTFTLAEPVCGEHDIFFRFGDYEQRLDLGGFFFEAKEKAYERIMAAHCDLVHGDNFTENGDRIENIGNNVFFDFEGMDFTKGISAIEICGRTRHDNDSIHIYVVGDDGNEVRSIAEFPFSEEYSSVTVPYPDFKGRATVKFCFLPGCDFDLDSFRFIPAE